MKTQSLLIVALLAGSAVVAPSPAEAGPVAWAKGALAKRAYLTKTPDAKRAYRMNVAILGNRREALEYTIRAANTDHPFAAPTTKQVRKMELGGQVRAAKVGKMSAVEIELAH